MARRFLFFVFFCIGICTAWVEERPVLETRDGNLVIASARDRNITLLTFGKSTVKINDIDLVEVSRHARKAARDVEKWQVGYLRDLTANVERLINTIEGPDGLQHKLNIIEIGNNTLANSSMNVPASPRGSRINTGDQLYRTALIHLQNRVDKLENKLGIISIKLREDECANNPCRNGGTCINTYTGFQCICPSNWEGSRCTEDVNECETFGGTTLGCQNGATCTNLPGSYRCDCSTGWHGIYCNTESATCNGQNSRKLCGHGNCVTTAKSKLRYTCECDQGWKSDGTDPACTEDIDECIEGQPRCSVDPFVPCINLPGGYKCGSCPPGYTGNGRHCIDIDECLVENGGCSTEPMVDCENRIGSRDCGNCPPGYEGDGMTCTYVGVCKINNGGCHPRATCVESPVFTNGFPQCNCPAGYHGDGIGPKGCELGSEVKNPCASSPCIHGICISSGTLHHCVCHVGFTGTYCDSSVDPCSPNPCENNGICDSEDTVKFTCECTPDFSGPRCQSQRQPCGGLFRNPRGTLRYPIPDESPKESLACAYIIVADKSKVLNITFLEFDIEPSKNCESTFLQINDGRNDGAHLLGRYCNSSLPLDRSFTTTHNAVYLLLQSNKSTDRRKFFLRWESIAPACGGLFSGDHGVISSPGSPGKYPVNRDCRWKVNVKPGKRIQFHFYSLSMEQHLTCDYDYVEISDTTNKKDILLGRFCNHTLPAPLLSSGSNAEVHFHSDADGNDFGFQMSYSTVEGVPGCGGVFTADHGIISSPGYPSRYSPNIACEWKIQLQQGLKVRLTWMTIDLQPGEGCPYDSVKVFSGPDMESPVVGTHCGNKLPAVRIINSNIVLIVFETYNSFGERRGFQLAYETICGAEFYESSGTIKSLHYPDSYPEKRTCIYEIIQPPQLGIMLTIVDMDILGDPPCYSDHLEIYDGDSVKSPRLGKICGGVNEIPTRSYFSGLNFMYLKFSTSGKSAENRGFLANYSTFNHDCGGIWTAPTGVIENSRHGDDNNCTWIIKAPEGHVIQITFKTFDLYRPSGNCSDHFVAIYDGVIGSGQEIGRYCTTYPPIVTTQGNIMTIMHNSNGKDEDEFEIHYIFLDTANTCGGHYFTSTGLITTPNYPKPYPMHTSCEWIITVPNKHQITLDIKDFQIEDRVDCTVDFLEVRAGRSEASILIGKYCGTSIPKTLKSFTNHMHLKFVSHSNDQRGFTIEWDSSTFGCGGTLTGSNGQIFSPNYPQPYHHLASCVWNIRTNAGNQLHLYFVDFDIEDDETCSSDYIEILSGVDGHRVNNTRYCHTISSPIDVDSNLATIRFRSDHANSGRGFHIKYESRCVHKVRGYNGVIESPNFPHQYPGHVNCSWIIEAPQGNKINLTFSHFHLLRIGLELSYCPVTFLSIKEGSLDRPNTDIGKFCNENTLPEQISSTQNQVFLHFEASAYFQHEGFRLEWRVFGCGGHFMRPSGDFSSPSYPDYYSKNFVCEWLIEVDRSHSVEINFSNMNLDNIGGCRRNRVELYGGTDAHDPMLATLCHSGRPVKYTSPTNKMFVKFVVDAQTTWREWKATYKSVKLSCGGTFHASKGIIHSPNYPLNYPNNQNCEWLIIVDKNHVVNLTFTDFDIEDTTNCMSDYVEVIDGTSRDAPLLGSFCKTELPPPILSTGNSMLAVMRSDSRQTSKGFRAHFEKTCGARIVTNSTGVLDIALDPQLGDAGNHCTWIIVASDPADHVTISFSHMEIAGLFENCNDHYIQIHEGEGTDGPLRDRYCTRVIPLPITSAGNALTVYMYGDNRDRIKATYSVFDSACGGEYISEVGTIASPGYPDYYPTNAECVWLLKTSPGNVIQLSFSTFELVHSPNCDRQYLEIREDSAIGKLLGVYCVNIPSLIESSKNLWIKFRTDDSETAEGFIGEYNVMPDAKLTGTSGEITSPLYPYPWKGGKVLSWRITAEYKMGIRVDFDDVHIDDGDLCRFSVAIYDGYDNEAPKLASVCGFSPPKDPIVSSSNVIFIQYSGIFIYESEIWFHLNWYQVPSFGHRIGNTFTKISDCDGEYDLTSTNSTVTFNSPGFPNGYRPDLDCTWVITTQQGYHLSMEFLTLDLEKNPNCIADYVTVYNGHGLATILEESQILKTACLNSEIGKTIQGNSVMTVKFHSDFFLGGSGFQAMVWRESGGTYNGPNGVIDSNDLWTSNDGENISNITLEWYITVQRGRTIEVTFDKFSVINIEQTGCHDNYLLLRNGVDAESPFLNVGKFCDQSRPPAKLETTGNKLYVKAVGFYLQLNFKLLYKEVRMSCGGSFRLGETNTRMSLNSPNYPNIPPSFTDCVWTFLAPAGERLTLHFVDRFDLTASSNCTEEYVEVRDGGTEHSESLGAFCGNMLPSSMTTTGNMMHIHFYTDVLDPKNGFNATVMVGEVCGQLLRGETGIVMSPNYPNTYPVNQECSWMIVGPSDHTLAIEFQDLDLPILDNCEDSDYIKIGQRNLFENTVTDLGRWCGTNKPTLVETSTNIAVVSFHSGNTIADYRGFSLNYTASKETCGGEFFGRSGVIQTTGYPNPSMRTRSCKWLITVPEGNLVVLHISDMFNARQESRLRLYNDKNAKSEITKMGTASYIIEALSSSNYMLIVYQSNAGHQGFKAYFRAEPAHCGGSFNDETGSLLLPKSPFDEYSFYCHWELRAPDSIIESGNGTTLTFTVSGSLGDYTPQSRFCEDQTKYISVSDDQQKIGTVCGNLTKDTKVFRSPSPVNIVELMNGTLGGHISLKMNYDWNACGGILKGPSHTIAPPENMTYPRSCVWHAKFDDPGAVISMDIKRLNFGSCNDKGYILVRNGGPLSPIIGVYCGNTKPGIITSSSNQLWIEYWAAEPPDDFEFEVNLVSGSCGGAIRGSSNEIISPGFPKQYPENAECTWEITADPGFTIGLIFIDRFNLETSDQCTNDFIQVFNWVYDASGLGRWDDGIKYCGRNAPPALNSTSNRVKVLFRSNDLIEGDGFRARWEQNCGGIFEATHQMQSIQSPHYPDAYTPNQRCNYTIQAPQNKEMLIEFTDFDIESGDEHGECKFDNITVASYYFRYGYVHHYFGASRVMCGDDMPRHMYVDDRAYILFQSDAHIQKRGYRFQYMLTECGGEITKPTQLSPPRMKLGEYFGRFNCTWVIRAPQQKSVTLHFGKLSIPFSLGCSTDELRAVEGNTLQQRTSLAKICGTYTGALPRVKSIGNLMTVMFRSDGSNGNGYMSAMVTFSNNEASGCGGTIHLEQSMSFKTQKTMTYDPFTECEWKIRVVSGKQIRLTINRMDLINATNTGNNTDGSCNGDFLEVRDGSNSGSNLIGRYCGSTVPAPITSLTNALWIKFFSDDTGEGEGVSATLEPTYGICGNDFWEITNEAVVIESPEYPADFPAGIECQWIFKSNQLLRIHFDYIDMEDTQNCDGDHLEIIHKTIHGKIILNMTKLQTNNNMSAKDDNDDSRYFSPYGHHALMREESVVQSPYKYCGESNSISHYSDTNELQVMLKTTTENLPKSRKFKFTVEKATCNRNYTAKQGRIIQQDIKDCWITITAPWDFTISLYFNQLMFPLEECSSAYLEVHDGDFSANSTHLCRSIVTSAIFSTGNQLSLHAISTTMLPFLRTHFDIQYTTTNKGRGCGGELYNYEGIFTSPMYPGKYRTEGTCEWEINVPRGYAVRLSFEYFDLSANDDCSTDYLKIREKNRNEELFCPGPTPADYNSPNDRLIVVYASSGNNSGTGWKIRFKAIMPTSNDDEDSSDYTYSDYFD